MTRVRQLRADPRAGWVIGGAVVLAFALMPLFRAPLDGFTCDAILALAYVVMALGLNLVVGFAGLLDLGYVAFYALGLMATGWWASDFYSGVKDQKGIHIGASNFADKLPGIHLNFLILIVGAIVICAIAGIIIGLPTLRLRGDYIAIVTLAFGEIISRVFANGDSLEIFHNDAISNGRQSISPIDQINLPIFGELDSATSLRPYYWCVLALCLVVLFVNFRLRDSRLGRAWIALREDEVAAASMGVPLVKTKLLSYAAGGAFGGISGCFLGPFFASVNANQFMFGVSIFILGMVILGGLGSIWGVLLGAILLSFVNSWLIPDVLDGEWMQGKLSSLGLNFQFSEVEFGVFGFILLLMMVLRPEGLIPERRHQLELTEMTPGELEEPGQLHATYEARA
jgi:branched-chain amino acid transport system permease protein